MSQRKQSPEVTLPLTRYDSWSGGRRNLVVGDKIRVSLPPTGRTKVVEFLGYVVPDRGRSFMEVLEDGYRIRCIDPSQIISKKRPRRVVTA